MNKWLLIYLNYIPLRLRMVPVLCDDDDIINNTIIYNGTVLYFSIPSVIEGKNGRERRRRRVKIIEKVQSVHHAFKLQYFTRPPSLLLHRRIENRHFPNLNQPTPSCPSQILLLRWPLRPFPSGLCRNCQIS